MVHWSTSEKPAAVARIWPTNWPNRCAEINCACMQHVTVIQNLEPELLLLNNAQTVKVEKGPNCIRVL